MVDWQKIEGKIREIKPVSIPGPAILDSLISNRSFLTTVQAEGVNIDVNLKQLFRPLGDLWRVLYNEGDYVTLRQAITTYWKYKGTPIITADILQGDTETYPIRISMAISESQKKNYVDVNRLLKEVNESVDYDRVVLGSDDHNLEFQFLSKRTEKAVKPGDLIQSGIFVHVNGGVRVSPGVHRLVCSNGLTQGMHLWRGANYKFGDSMVNEGVGLANWLIKQADHPIKNFREISVALKDLPANSLKNFSKQWAEKIDLKDLTWYDVINDLTASVNDTLTNKRYRIMAVSSELFDYEKNHRCPSCSASVGTT